jgi:hypothetical protein
MQREKWFEKVAWSYVPCHWKGFAIMFAVILPTLAAIFTGEAVLGHFRYGAADWLPFLVFFPPAWLVMVGIAKRHS